MQHTWTATLLIEAEESKRPKCSITEEAAATHMANWGLNPADFLQKTEVRCGRWRLNRIGETR